MKEDSLQGVWDNLAEKMLIEFDESGCPIFRAMTPLSRGQLKSKRHAKKLSIHFAAASLFLQTSSVLVEQSQRYVKSMNPFTRERWDLLWWDNQVPYLYSV